MVPGARFIRAMTTLSCWQVIVYMIRQLSHIAYGIMYQATNYVAWHTVNHPTWSAPLYSSWQVFRTFCEWLWTNVCTLLFFYTAR